MYTQTQSETKPLYLLRRDNVVEFKVQMNGCMAIPVCSFCATLRRVGLQDLPTQLYSHLAPEILCMCACMCVCVCGGGG